MSEQKKWWSGHSLYGIQPQEYRFRNSIFQEIPYIDLSPDTREELQLSYWKSMYPEKIKKVQKWVEEACEELEYDNSPMYDEYPDKIFLKRLCSKIYEDVLKEDEFKSEETSEELFDISAFQSAYAAINAGRNYSEEPSVKIKGRKRAAKRQEGQILQPQKDLWLRDIIEVLLYQEMHRRRCARKKYGRINIWT